MDLVTQAILAGAASGAASKVTEEATKVVAAAYEKLKSIIKKKFPEQRDLTQAIEMLEGNPQSKGRQELLGEEAVKSKLAEDVEVRSAAESLLLLLPEGQRHEQHVSGIGNAVADHGSIAISNVTGWPPK